MGQVSKAGQEGRQEARLARRAKEWPSLSPGLWLTLTRGPACFTLDSSLSHVWSLGAITHVLGSRFRISHSLS